MILNPLRLDKMSVMSCCVVCEASTKLLLPLLLHVTCSLKRAYVKKVNFSFSLLYFGNEKMYPFYLSIPNILQNRWFLC